MQCKSPLRGDYRQYGVPWGQDRLVPIFLATLAMRQQKQTITFRSAAEMLDVFGMQGGSQYRRLIASFQRIFGATIFFGTDTQREKAIVSHQARFNFMREARIWYSRDPNQTALPGGFENEIVLSDEFFREVTTHSIPTDLEAAKALSSSPAALDLFMWLSYRCFTAKGPERVPIFGDLGLAGQLGSADYVRPRKFRERLERSDGHRLFGFRRSGSHQISIRAYRQMPRSPVTTSTTRSSATISGSYANKLQR
jgi:Plasmid encoded RepA protein